jgi:hypothetical protein
LRALDTARAGVLDADCDAWLREATDLCRAGGFQTWLRQIARHDRIALTAPTGLRPGPHLVTRE